MKKFAVMVVVAVCLLWFPGHRLAQGDVGLPTETFALPAVAGWVWIGIYSTGTGQWIVNETPYQPSEYEFNVPAWSTWYWLGVFDYSSGQWVKSTWFGHFKTT